MKIKRWIPLIVTTAVALVMAVGLLSNPFRFSPVFGKGYESVFYAYTSNSIHASGFEVCLTDDGHVVLPNGRPTPAAKLRRISFDPAAFCALSADFGYWNGDYSLEYISEHVDKAWYGTSIQPKLPTMVFYVLQLEDGSVLLVEGSAAPDGSHRGINKVYVLEPRMDQSVFFEMWNAMISNNDDYDNDYYDLWRELYLKYR